MLANTDNLAPGARAALDGLAVEGGAVADAVRARRVRRSARGRTAQRSPGRAFGMAGRYVWAAMASTFFVTTAIVSWSCALAVNSIVSVPGSADGVWPGGA